MFLSQDVLSSTSGCLFFMIFLAVCSAHVLRANLGGLQVVDLDTALSGSDTGHHALIAGVPPDRCLLAHGVQQEQGCRGCSLPASV